jgi:hypothetical protein
MSPSSSFKTKSHYKRRHLSLSLSLSEQIASANDSNYSDQDWKTSLNLPKQWNITNCSATADCIYVYVHVAGIGKEET